MIDLRPVGAGIRATQRFSTRLINDLNPDGGGFKHWHHALDATNASPLADYLVGAVQAAGLGLQSAGVGLHDYLEWRDKQDSAARINMTRHKTPYPPGGDDHYDERELRLDVSEQRVFMGCGSVLDGLSAALIGVLGLPLDIHRASFRDFRPTEQASGALRRKLLPNDSAGGQLQRANLATFASVLSSSGPEGWYDWVFGMRNVALHRENRNEITDVTQTRLEGWKTSRMFASNPEFSNLQALQTANTRMDDLYLHEDVRTTLRGCIESIDALTVATIDMLERTWERRTDDPALIVQPAAQWQPRETGSRFVGYDRGSAKIGKHSQIHANPLDLHRMRSGGLLGQTQR